MLALTKPGVVANLTFNDQLLDIHIIEPPKDFGELPIAPARRVEPQMPTGDDPFADTDLPVDIQ